jgi:hypothetical protein
MRTNGTLIREGFPMRVLTSIVMAAAFVIRFSLIAVTLILNSTLATAQQVCQKAGQGSKDPNATLSWTLTTRVNTPCIQAVNPGSNWINTGRHVVVRPKHGKVGFSSDPTHFVYNPQSGFTGTDEFVIQFDRRIFTTNQHAHRVIAFTVNVTP